MDTMARKRTGNLSEKAEKLTRSDYLSLLDKNRAIIRKVPLRQRGGGTPGDPLNRTKYFKKYYNLLKVLADGTRYPVEQRRKIVQTLTSEQLYGIQQSIYGILRKEIYIEPKILKKLTKYSPQLLALLRAKATRKARIKALFSTTQNGGNPLLAALVPMIIGSVLKPVINKILH